MAEVEAKGQSIDQVNSLGDFVAGNTLRSANDLRKKLGIDELNYQKVVAHAHGDARAFFLYGCVDEVIKAATASLRWTEFLSDSEDAKTEEHEDAEYIHRTVLEALFDEQQMWSRKLKELLVDLILFSQTNEQNYYRIYFGYKYLEKYLGFQSDLTEYFGCRNGNADVTLRDTRRLITRLESEVDRARLWFLKKPKLQADLRPGGIFTSFKKRLSSALELGTADQRIALGISYDRGYSVASRSIHSNIGDPLSEISDRSIDSQIGRIGLLSGHVVVCAFDLAGIEPTGIAAQIKASLNGTDAATKLHSAMCTEFKVGDVVMVYGSYLSVVTETAKSKYGYTSCKVRYLIKPMLEETPEDWFSAPYVKMLYPKEKLLPMLKEILKQHGSSELLDSLSDDAFVEAVSTSVRQMHKSACWEKFFRH